MRKQHGMNKWSTINYVKSQSIFNIGKLHIKLHTEDIYISNKLNKYY